MTNDGQRFSARLFAPRAGGYRVRVTYTSKGKAYYPLLVDGAYEGAAVLEAEGNGVFVSPAMRLSEGVHDVQAIQGWGAARIIGLTLTAPEAVAWERPDFRLTNPNASAQCKRVMRALSQTYGKRVLTGQHLNGSNADLERIAALSGGQVPAVIGLDMMAFSSGCRPPKRSADCEDEVDNGTENINRALYWGRDRGALVTLCWHWFSPAGGEDRSFYTKHTSFDLASALRTKDERYGLLLSDIDTVAAQLKRLAEADVPVLWRPLHEAEGKWFWWGASGAESYVELYRLMYDRMTHVHKLDNLIWVWNAPERAWYPGDDVVDIASMDVYAPEGNGGAMAMEFARGMAAGGRSLPMALGEVGVAPNLERVAAQGLPWLWFMLWCGFTGDLKQNGDAHLREVFTSPCAVNLAQYHTLMEANA